MNPRRTVLIVDDEPLLVETIAFNLQKADLCVLKAFDGESGLEQALEHRPQLVILDVMLPQLSGWDVCRKLRAADARLPILMLTARGTARDKEKSFEAGASAFLLKPFGMQELLERVEELLRKVDSEAA